MGGAKSISSVKSISSSVDQSRRYLLGWLAAILLTCTVLVVNSPAYALPALPVMALLVAYQIDDWINTGKNDLIVSRYYKSASLILALAGVVLLLASALFAIEFLPESFGLAESDWFSARCSSWMRISLVAGPFLVAMMLCWQFFKVMTGKLQGSINTLFVSAVTMTVIATPIAFKFAYEIFDADLHRAAKVLIGKSDGQVAIFRESMPSLSYYLARPVTSFVDPNLLEQDASVFGRVTSEKTPNSLTKPPSSTVYVIGRVSKIVPLVRTHSLRVLSKRGEWLVVEAEKASLKNLAH